MPSPLSFFRPSLPEDPLPAFLPRDLIEEIAVMHAGEDRGYHGWGHPLALLRLHREIAGRLHDPDAVAAAILLHDAVYDPRRSDNEARSAELAAERLAPFLPEPRVQRVRRLIEATARHTVPSDALADEVTDIQLFLDMDLSILGASEAEFDAYEDGVRHEYRHMAPVAFAVGRAAILERFLGRPQIYLTEWGRTCFEVQARQNLRRSIVRLKELSPP